MNCDKHDWTRFNELQATSAYLNKERRTYEQAIREAREKAAKTR